MISADGPSLIIGGLGVEQSTVSIAAQAGSVLVAVYAHVTVPRRIGIVLSGSAATASAWRSTAWCRPRRSGPGRPRAQPPRQLR
jgi:hypothetical protein